MKWVWIIFVIFCILLFTFLFRRLRNPITNLHIYYYDGTIENDTDIVRTILDSYNIFNVYSIYMIASIQKPLLTKSVTLRAYIYKLNDTYMTILLSYRFTLSQFDDTPQGIVMNIIDSIIRLPIISGYWAYHKFSIVLNRKCVNEEQPILTKHGIYINETLNGIFVNEQNITIESAKYITIHKKLFKYYTLGLN
jgi:hypothetical protein